MGKPRNKQELTGILEKQVDKEYNRFMEENRCNKENGMTTYCINYNTKYCQKTCYYANERWGK